MRRERVYMRGSRISEAMEKKVGVPAYEKIMIEMADTASAKVGEPMILKSEDHGPSWGAAAGRS
jgi:hypothetical protein